MAGNSPGANRRRRKGRRRDDFTESEELFLQIAEHINSVFWIRDLRGGKILYISPAYEEIWGCSREEVYANPDSWLRVVHAEDFHAVRESHGQSAPRGASKEYRIVRPDGSVRWIRAKVFTIRNEEGEASREAGIAEDITDYRLLLDRLRESEERFRKLFETSIDGISISRVLPDTGRKKLIACNASYAQMADRAMAKLLGAEDIREFQDFPQGRGCCPTVYGPGELRENVMCGNVYSWLRPDGKKNFVECRGSPLFINNVEFMHCVHRDVTQARLADEKIRHLSRRLIEVVEEEQKRISRDLHDEFGQILPTLRYRIDTLQAKAAGSSRALNGDLAEIGAMIGAIGAIIRRTTNRLRPDMLDTLGFLPTMEWTLRDFARRHPEVQACFKVIGTPRKIRPEYEIALYRILQEALVNAGKHAGADRVSAWLVFSYPAVILHVEDNGRGFDPGAEAAVTPSGEKGGLGLRSMQERMATIGGSLRIRSQRGAGTRIRAEVFQPPEENGDAPVA